jgi:hypothetical protein
MIACMYIGIILYQPIWLCALCDLYWEQVHVANLYRHILYHFWLYDCMYCTYRDIYYISPSGCVHYVACIGNRYTLQNLYRHILYHFWLYDCMYCTYRDIYYISPSGCVHYVACIGNRYTLQNLYRHISFVIIWLHVMYISQHIYLYPSVWLCALCNLYWGTGTCCKLIPKHILYHLWLYDCM